MATLTTVNKKNSKALAKKQKSSELATDFVPVQDPTQEPGHKKMNLKTEFGKAAAAQERSKKLAGLEAVTRADDIRRKETPQRRVPNSGNKVISR